MEQCVKGAVLNMNESNSLVLQALYLTRDLDHVMEYSDIRVLEALFTLIRKGVERVVEYN